MLLREPANSLTHFAGMLAAIPASLFLLRLCRGDRVKFVGMLIYSISLVFCYGCSALFHAVPADVSEDYVLYDHFGIYMLIAGTVTPIALIVLRGRWRIGLLVVIWSLAAVGIALRIFVDTNLALRTALYLGMGWVGCSMYFQLVRLLSHRKVAPMWLGGLCYSIGAVINLTWKQFPPLVSSFLVGPHEVFHVFVIAGSVCHYYFMVAVLIPYRRQPVLTPAFTPVFTEASAPPTHAPVGTPSNNGHRSGSTVNAETHR